MKNQVKEKNLVFTVFSKLSQYALAEERSNLPVSIIILEKFENIMVAPNLRSSANKRANTFCIT